MATKFDHLTDNPHCGVNRQKSDKEKVKRCWKPTPGATAGGCAFDGAQIVLLPVGDAVHLIHGPATCTSQNWNNRGSVNEYGEFYKMGFTTDVSEMDIIFGAESKIVSEAIRLAKKYKPKAVFVYSTCVTAMTGEDIVTACRTAEEQAGIPVVPVESPGFSGNKNFGNKIAGDALMNYVIGTAEPEDFGKKVDDLTINIIGDYNIAGELDDMLPIFKKLGINVLSRITGGCTYDELRYAHRAKMNIVICSRALVSLAGAMLSKYGIPFIEGSFYGMEQIRETILNMCKTLENEELYAKAEKLLDKYETETNKRLEPYIKELTGKKVFVYTGGVKSWSVVCQLEELGMEVIGTSTRKSTEEDIEKLRERFEGTQKMLLEKGDGRKLLGILEENKADLLLAGGRNMYTAMKSRYPFVDVNQERVFSYTAYEGMIELARQVCNTINSPVFALAKTKAPWDEAEDTEA